MYHDLNVRIAGDRRSQALNDLYCFGYDVVAFTTEVKGTSQLIPAVCPERKTQKWCPLNEHPLKRKRKMTVLERVTLVIEDASQLVLLSSKLIPKFDLVAVQPTTDKLLQQCLQFDFDIISIDLSKKLPFYIKKQHANVAAEKGIVFEINYSETLRDRASRRFVVSNACGLTRVTSGKHIIVSSGACKLMEFRGPHDVINLATIFDLSYENARHSITSLAQRSAAHGDVRVNTFKGIVRVIGDVDDNETMTIKKECDDDCVMPAHSPDRET